MFWGTYDLSKPRNRILIQGLLENGVLLDQCHSSIWEDVRDKGTLTPWRIARHVLRVVLAYPRLIAQFWAMPTPDVIVVGYLGQLDVLVLYPFAALRGVPVVWDQFISLYDTVVDDRKKVSPRNPLAKLLYAWEWASCRSADCVLMDTRAHAAYVQKMFGLTKTAVESVWVGAETAAFPEAPPRQRNDEPCTVLFYGQLIPLHGVETIILAARLLEQHPIRFVLIGSGQEEVRVRELLSERASPNIEWHAWVEYERLSEWVARADICLGIFGETDKASRVIPNKVFQILAARRPLITRASPAIVELLDGDMEGVRLIRPGDPRALADAVLSLADRRGAPANVLDLRQLISPEAIGRQLLDVLCRVTRSAGRRLG